MAMITISRGSYSKGKEVAEGVASQLGYTCISRDVLLEASDQFNIPEIKLVRAIHDAPSILNNFTHGKTSYIAYIQSALLEHAKKGNIVYHGLAGHILLRGIPHVLKVRIIADLDTRVAAEMDREQIDITEARSVILRDDEERRKWTKKLYGVDPWDPALYDLLICIDKIEVQGAIDIICLAASFKPFQPTGDSREKLDDLILACQVKSRLLDLDRNVEVIAEYGNVIVHTKADLRKARKLEEKIKMLTKEIEAIHNIDLRVRSVKPSADA